MKATILQSTLLLSLASVAFSSPLSYDNGYGHTTKVSSDQSCGGANGYTCAGSQWGNCCSTRGHCGNTADYCKAGCQSKYGKCGDSEIVKPKPSYEQTPGYGKPSGPPVSKNGHCGKMNGHTCIGSVFGQCCSQRGNWLRKVR
ncbi:carbohydrate-binding module family 18 protein [Glonium stellatum]|uniref:Carbohydrate-binding module family 18 protein n=1 Tax=Glonium stellatum TaxID=574774 RepID=A0A8E2JWS4_9PEZI|nr:carbohydrate-binding module family 18 protein [Glonium stellatum]